MQSVRQEQAHDRRTVEIVYVLVSCVVLFAVLAAAYKRVDPAWQGGLSAAGLPGAVLVITLLARRGVHMLRRLELDLRS